MDFLLPLTIIGFIISVYQISEEAKKRNFVFKFSGLDMAFICSFSILLIIAIFSALFFSDQETTPYIEFSQTEHPFLYEYITLNEYIITYSFLSSIIAFVLSVILIFFFIRKLNSTKLKQKHNFVSNSLDKLGRQKYADVAVDLELFHYDLLTSYKPTNSKMQYFFGYINFIANVLKNNISMQTMRSPRLVIKNIRREVVSYNIYKAKQKQISESIGKKLISTLTNNKSNSVQNPINILQFIKSKRESYCQFIDNYYYELTGNIAFLEYIAMNNTDLMFMLIDNDLPYRKDDVWSIFGTKLISDKTSKLHKELSETEKGQSKIIDYIFYDIDKASSWLVWRPVGEYVIQHLREQGRKDIDEYNNYEENYGERKNYTPLYSGIKFFDIMVKQTLRQNRDDHMWLMYFKYWVEHILHNISYTNHKDTEFSNMYEYCLYLIIECLRDWIRYAKKEEYKPENKLIIEYSIKTIVEIMEKISSSPELREKFKNDSRKLIIENYFELAAYHDQEKMSPYVEQYQKSIKDNICMNSGINQSFIDFLKYPVEHFDNRMIWERGIYYSDELRNDFIQFLYSLSGGTGKCSMN